MKKITLLLLAINLCSAVSGQDNELTRKLFYLPDISFEEIETPNGFKSAYLLSIKQPIDHFDLSKGYFYQKAYLSDRGFEKPMVFVTEGYSLSSNLQYELTELLDANQLIVEHRFFGGSMPDSINYKYLTLEQECADLHNINRLFREVYNGKWISSGISKGGQTTIFYRYLYPDDVDASVSYVSTFCLSLQDERIVQYLDTIGSLTCHDRIEEFQKEMLKDRKDIVKLLEGFSLGARLKFSYLTLEQAFEYAILEYPFSFWQWGHDCQEIPQSNASDVDKLKHLMDVFNINFYSDRGINYYASHYYQAASEMGYYGYKTDNLKGLLKALPIDSYPSAIFVPNRMPLSYDNTLANRVFDWTKTSTSHIIYIYGENDPWSATKVPASNNKDCLIFMMRGHHHGSARIKNMTIDEKEKLISTLENWLGIKIFLDPKMKVLAP